MKIKLEAKIIEDAEGDRWVLWPDGRYRIVLNNDNGGLTEEQLERTYGPLKIWQSPA